METEKDPFEAVRAMMHENLEKVGGATQGYLDMLEKTMRGANKHLQGIHRAASCSQPRVHGEAFGCQDFQEAFRIQAEYFQSRLKACAEDAAQIGAKMAGSFKTSIPPEPNIA